MNKAIEITTTIAVICAGLVILSAGILGYTALYDLFVSIGLFAAWLALFFPLLFDLAEVTSAVVVFNAKLQGEDDRFAWAMVLLFTGLGIVANIAHALAAWWVGRIDTLQAILAVFATSLFPLSIALVTHLVKRVISRDIGRRSILSSLAELAGQRDSLLAEVARLVSQAEAASVKLAVLQSDIKAAHFQQKARSVEDLNAARFAKIEQRQAKVLHLLGQGLGPSAIAGELGVSLTTAKRDIQRLNGAAAQARGMVQ